MARDQKGFPLARGLAPFGVLLALAVAIYSVLWFVDYGRWERNPFALWTGPGAYDVLSNFAEITIAVLGIAITVVAILVELASTRYTARVAELFVRDRVSRLVMGFFVVSSVVILWVELSLREGAQPRAMALTAVVLETSSLLLLLPYFVYVFDFLSPTRVIERIQEDGAQQLTSLLGRAPRLEEARTNVVRAIEQLGDIALNSIENKDKSLTLAAVAALEHVASHSVSTKRQLPEAWFDTAGLAQIDQDFIALHPDMVRALTARRTWVEMKVFRQYQDVFGEAVNRMRDVNHLIAIHTRRLVKGALEADDPHTVDLAVKFFNTYFRSAINARDVRTAYNLFNEYRLVAEHALRMGRSPLVIDLATHMKFYGQLAFSSNLAFLLETAAFDLSMLLEAAHAENASCHDELLSVFLDVDREPEGHRAQEASLRGVRKAQIRLATWYLAAGDAARAERIAKDMAAEPRDRLRSIRGELERVTDQEYWEVSDRGVNFEWLPPERRAQLPAFFALLEL
jgi:hypothetical protein